jgi:hypothetical protein
VNRMLPAGVSQNIRIYDSFPRTRYSLGIILRIIFALCVSRCLAGHAVNHDTCYPPLHATQLLRGACDLSAYSSVV